MRLHMLHMHTCPCGARHVCVRSCQHHNVAVVTARLPEDMPYDAKLGQNVMSTCADCKLTVGATMQTLRLGHRAYEN
jgi:hypothetical protein